MSKSKHDEAQQILDDLDSFTPLPEAGLAGGTPSADNGGPSPASNTGNEGEAEALAFLDEITRKSSEPTLRPSSLTDRPLSRAGTPSLRKPTERVKLGGSSLAPSSSKVADTVAKAPASVGATADGHGSTSAWGWGSVWSSASVAIQQARTVVDEQVKNLPNNEQAKKWVEYAKTAQLDRLGQDFKRVGLSTLTDILNVVAPPISAHEVIKVWLSHDMRGYEGIESLVYKAFAKVMEQVEGGDLIVNRGNESRYKDDAPGNGRELNSVEGYDAAVKLAQADLEEVIKNKQAAEATPSLGEHSAQAPVTDSHIYLRVQPFMTSQSLPSTEGQPIEGLKQAQLQFLFYLMDPSHNLAQATVTQAVPAQWLEIWDEFDWVEDLVAEALRVGVEVIGQEYIVSRMGWATRAVGQPIAEQDEKPDSNS